MRSINISTIVYVLSKHQTDTLEPDDHHKKIFYHRKHYLKKLDFGGNGMIFSVSASVRDNSTRESINEVVVKKTKYRNDISMLHELNILEKIRSNPHKNLILMDFILPTDTRINTGSIFFPLYPFDINSYIVHQPNKVISEHVMKKIVVQVS